MTRAALGLVALLPLLAACGGAAQPQRHASAPRATHRSDPSRFLRAGTRSSAVELTMIAGDGGENNGFNFDGYGRGRLLVRVPRGWKVTVRFRNAGVRFDSCAVVTGPGASAPAFAGATTPNPATGLAPGGTATFSFVASRTGSYRFASVVPGHELARMWDVLEVTSGGQPAIAARPGP